MSEKQLPDEIKKLEDERRREEENKKKAELINNLDFDDQKRLLLEINDKLGSINSKLSYLVALGVLAIVSLIVLDLFI